MIGQQSERLKSFRISREKVIIGFMGCENVNIPLNRWSILLCCATGATGEKRTHTHPHRSKSMGVNRQDIYQNSKYTRRDVPFWATESA